MSKKFQIDPKMVDTAQASALYPWSAGTFQNKRSKKEGPKYYKVGRKVVYALTDLEDFFTASPVLTVDSLPEASR